MKRFARIASLFLTAAVCTGILTSCGAKDVGEFPQLEDVQKGDKIAVITVKDYGTIKIRFFEDLVPKAVENFIGLAEEGYYDELTFHRVSEDFMIQGGDPKGDGTGGQSLWGGTFEDEIVPQLRHFRGAVAYANRGEDTNGSQFYIVQQGNEEIDDDYLKQCEENADIKLPNDVKEKYKEVGGSPFLDGGYTIFAQVFEGMDVVDKIASCKVIDEYPYETPYDEVLIEKIEIMEYEG